MPTAVYRYRPQAKGNEKLQHWLTDHPDETMNYTDADIHRPQLLELLRDMEAGAYDRVVVGKLSDLGMTAQRLSAFLDDCRSRNVTLASVQECFDLMTEQGKKLAAFLVKVAQADRKVLNDLQRDGIATAKAAGRSWGGRKVGTRIRVSQAVERRINELFAAGTPIMEIAKDDDVRVSVRSVYRVVGKTDRERG